MAKVIARVRRELQDRLKEIETELGSVEALIAEKARLERVLSTPPFAGDRPVRSRKPARRRAPRGANRAAVFAALETMPGASAGEIAAAARIGRSQAYAVLRAGVEQGEVVAISLAGGQTGYRIGAPTETAFPAPEAPPEISLTKTGAHEAADASVS